MADFEKMERTIDAIAGKVDELLVWQGRMEERCTSHRIQTDELRKTVFDNPGLKLKVQTLWNCKQNITKWREFWMIILRYLIIAVIISVCGFLFVMYKKFG